ncbi:MAG: SPOR domain-containing protein, partial [Alphaproteobacteria bacterium]|nr:SPOR domain-containing protein [Alphaproteobacteria bacterium]
APVAAASPSAPARAAAAAPTGQWLVQLASLPNEAQARKSWAEMKASLSPVLGRFDATFRTVDLGARGVFTRVYVGPFSGRDQANALCADLRQQAPKQGCIPTPPGS